MSKSDLNKVMVSLLSFDRASEIMINSCRNIVKSLSGDERFFYKEELTPYLIFLEKVKEDSGLIMN